MEYTFDAIIRQIPLSPPIAIKEFSAIFLTDKPLPLFSLGIRQEIIYRAKDIASITPSEKDVFFSKNSSYHNLWEIMRTFHMNDVSKIIDLTKNPELTDINEKYKLYFGYKEKNYDLIFSAQKSDTEPDLIPLLLNDISTAMETEHKYLVLKLNETYTIPTLKIIYILKECYKNIYFYKPVGSEKYIDEKYLICHDFGKKIDVTNILKEYKKIKGVYFCDIVDDLEVPKNLMSLVSSMNVEINMKQINILKKIIEYRHRRVSNNCREFDKESKKKDGETWDTIFLSKNNEVFKNMINAKIEMNKIIS